jgi:phosphatidylethanolamine/phosphatidyl-N-methylethanolamine N-methyltransferase
MLLLVASNVDYSKISRSKRRNRHHFLAAWLRSPLKMGALVPSSRALARAMAAQVTARSGAVIELGAGTGVVTHALVQAHIPPERLVVIERDLRLHALVMAQFPHLNVLCADAMELGAVLEEHHIDEINAIVSSLPLLSMPEQVRNAIIHQMATLIGDHGRIVQFTYGPRSPIRRGHLRKYRLAGRRVKLVVANIPPAHVWVYQRA